MPSGPRFVGGTPVFPHDTRNPLSVGPGKGIGNYSANLPTNLNVLNTNEGDMEEEKVTPPEEITINGIMCQNNRCIAYTSKGDIRSGSVIGNEKVLYVLKNGIKTNKRWISY